MCLRVTWSYYEYMIDHGSLHGMACGAILSTSVQISLHKRVLHGVPTVWLSSTGVICLAKYIIVCNVQGMAWSFNTAIEAALTLLKSTTLR